MYIDTHCHLDFSEFNLDRKETIERAQAAGVTTMINVAASIEGGRMSIALAREYPRIFATVGIHPHDARTWTPEAHKEIKELSRDKKVVAIGEVGLDYYRNLSAPDIQKKVFESFIKLAKERSLPLIVHSRNAEEDTLEILRKHDPKKVVIHCFTGGREFLEKCLDRKYYISFTGNITYPRQRTQELKDRVKYVPLDRMFLETDAPFLAPQNKRGQRNEPAFVVEVAKEVARIKSLTSEAVAEVTTRAAVGFFKFGGTTQ